MSFSLSAPETAFEWQVLATSLFGLYSLIGYTATGDLLYAISIGLYGGIGMTVVLAISVFSWRGIRDTFIQQQS
ncbi:hypothetical protein SAMN04489842_1395 [Natronobacterium texcoconense]|uniref:Uncharacterized protein n=1 Tax=Natronobacterium texcoconense TaxID=1095778 RepID=A0A1H1CGG5_NATTX|nr:hypothetical protein SAMN04489842_1395 [Natronobacterium texcoconense]